MKKIRLFHDYEDYHKVLTEDDVINILGTKGSGKTTTSIPYISNDKYIVINCDRLLELPSEEKEDKELSWIRKSLKNKYGTIPVGEKFLDCYNDIIDMIQKKKKIAIIEGNVIQDFDPCQLKGTVIIKRTGSFKSFIRAVRRDYHNSYFMNLERDKHKYFYKVTRFFKITKRRKSVFQQAKEMNEIIEKLED